MAAPILSRREWLKLSAAGALGASVSGWFDNFATAAAPHVRARKKQMILLWMNGGPSQMDTFDLKPGHVNGGPFKEISTNAPGLKISEHLPKIAKFGDKMAVLRSMTTKEADHSRGTFLMRTGYNPTGPIQYPPIGPIVAKELGNDESALPNCVAIAPYRFFSPTAYGPGFLGPKYAPLVVADNAQFIQGGRNTDYASTLKVQDVDVPADVDKAHASVRLDLLEEMEKEFSERHPSVSAHSHKTAYQRAVKLMKTAASKAFNVEDETASVRDKYGRSLFGQGCLLARRLIEQGVPFVEVTLGGVNNQAFGWDTHANNFDALKPLLEVLDGAWAALMGDLKDRGLLDSTLIVWMGEFGRTPKINPQKGRDHWPNSWSTVLAGGGINGGQAYGKTDKGGMEIKENPVKPADFMATIAKALGINPEKQNNSNVGRPIPIVEKGGHPIKEVTG
jgi:hypothetical protein